MRPTSHKEQIPARRCGNCRFAHVVEYKRDLLCFFGDKIEVAPGCNGDTSSVLLDGEVVGLMDGEDYSHVWGGRVLDDTDICDEWQPGPIK